MRLSGVSSGFGSDRRRIRVPSGRWKIDPNAFGSSIDLAQPRLCRQSPHLPEAKRAITYQATTKFTYATPDNSVYLGSNTQSGTVTLGSSWTLYKNEKLSSSGSQPPDHSFTIFLGISASLAGEGEKEKQALQEAALLEEKRLLSLQQSLDLLIRSKYASYLKDRDSVAEAERMVQAAKADSEVLQTRSRIGQISPEDEAAHRVLLERTTFNLKKARLNLAQAYLSMIQTANAWDLIGRVLENKQ